jgi:periplasmic copper chaperone A
MLGALLGSACASVAALAAPPVTVAQPWFRYITPQVPAGGYMTLRNGSGGSAVLVAASSPACGMLMLHRSETSGGADRMVPVNRIVVPPGGKVSFAPGGYHLMCMQPRMKPGESVSVTLKFEDGGSVPAAFQVYGAAGKPAGAK